MNFRAELIKAVVWSLIGAALLYFACVSPTSDASAFHPGFLEANDLPEEVFGGGIDDTFDRRLKGASDVPFIQNATNMRCASGEGDRVFSKSGMDLSGCFAKCQQKSRCNHFSIALTGTQAGRCIGCERGLVEHKRPFVFFTMQRSDQETTFSCPDGLVSSVNLDTLVDGDRPYELCVTKDGDDEPTCFDLRKGDQAAASITTCVASSSTSTTTTISSTTGTTTSASSSSTSATMTTSTTMTTSSTSTITTSSTSNTMTTTSTSTTMTTSSTSTTMTTSSTSTMTTSSTSTTMTTSSTSTTVTTSSTSTMTTSSTSNTMTTSSTSTSTMTTTSTSNTMTTSSTSTSTSTTYRFVPRTTPELKSALYLWTRDKRAALERYGEISTWSTSLIDNMDRLLMFGTGTYFNEDISSWDVSRVRSMNNMFYGIRGFKQNLSAWNVANVYQMSYMFSWATDFDVVLSSWDVSKVWTMQAMFEFASNFQADLSGWKPNPSRGVNMMSMFHRASDIHLKEVGALNVGDMRMMFARSTNVIVDMSSWNVGSVSNMQSTFEESDYNQDISKWDVSGVLWMDKMFKKNAIFNQDLRSWDVSKVRNMQDMFHGASAFNGNITTWTVSSVTSMSGMFRDAKAFSQDISGWVVHRVNYMDYMFWGADAFLHVDVSVWQAGSLYNAPRYFISSLSIACTDGDWTHWGSKKPLWCGA